MIRVTGAEGLLCYLLGTETDVNLGRNFKR
jgi:hypothetical protein